MGWLNTSTQKKKKKRTHPTPTHRKSSGIQNGVPYALRLGAVNGNQVGREGLRVPDETEVADADVVPGHVLDPPILDDVGGPVVNLSVLLPPSHVLHKLLDRRDEEHQRQRKDRRKRVERRQVRDKLNQTGACGEKGGTGGGEKRGGGGGEMVLETVQLAALWFADRCKRNAGRA